MNSSHTPHSSLQSANARPRDSSPLSRTIASGGPGSLPIRSSSTKYQPRWRGILPVLTQSLTKSMDQRRFGPFAARLINTPLRVDPSSLPNPHCQSFFAIPLVHACNPVDLEHIFATSNLATFISMAMEPSRLDSSRLLLAEAGSIPSSQVELTFMASSQRSCVYCKARGLFSKILYS
jgi:hypothetical protein